MLKKVLVQFFGIALLFVITVWMIFFGFEMIFDLLSFIGSLFIKYLIIFSLLLISYFAIARFLLKYKTIYSILVAVSLVFIVYYGHDLWVDYLFDNIILPGFFHYKP